MTSPEPHCGQAIEMAASFIARQLVAGFPSLSSGRKFPALTFGYDWTKIRERGLIAFSRKSGELMQVYQIEWECANCGQRQKFRRGINEEDGWPNKFEDLECENNDCRQVQDVPFRNCTDSPVEGTEEY
jgi:hypothetical protein